MDTLLYMNNLYDTELITGVTSNKKALYKAYFCYALYKYITVDSKAYKGLDIQKISLFINSGFFEINYLRHCKSVKSALNLIVYLRDSGEAIYRLFKLKDEYLDKYENLLYDLQKSIYNNSKYKCTSCKYFHKEVMTFGTRCNCSNRSHFWKIPREFKPMTKCEHYEKANNFKFYSIIPKEMQYIDINKKTDAIDFLNYITISNAQLIKNIKITTRLIQIFDACPKDYKTEINKALNWALIHYKDNRKIPNYIFYDPIQKRRYRKQLKFVNKLKEMPNG